MKWQIWERKGNEKSIPTVREREGNEKTIPKIRDWEGSEESQNSGTGNE